MHRLDFLYISCHEYRHSHIILLRLQVGITCLYKYNKNIRKNVTGNYICDLSNNPGSKLRFDINRAHFIFVLL